MASAANPHGRGALLAGVGVLVLSFDALLVRLAATDPWNVTFWRGWGIGLSMAALTLARREGVRLADGRALLAFLAAALLYGADNALFVFAVSSTRVANVVVILATSPFFAALFSRLFLGEPVPRRTLVAMALCAAGVTIVFAGSLGAGTLLGDGLALALSVVYAATLTLLRRFPELPRIALAGGAGCVAGLLAAPFAEPFALAPASYGWLALMGLLQMPLASVLILFSTRYLPSPEVGLFLLIETVLGPVWVWAALAEEPPPLTLVGGALLLATVAAHSWLALRDPAPRRAGAAAGGAGLARGP